MKDVITNIDLFEGKQKVVSATRKKQENGPFYQNELVQHALKVMFWNQEDGCSGILMGRAFYLEVSEDGLSVTVTEE